MSLDSRGIESQRFLPPSLEDRLIGFISRIGGAILLVIVAAFWASLLSWSGNDPSLTHATSGEPQNWMGAIGAVLSDLLLQTCGFAAALSLIAPMFWALEMLTSERLNEGRLKAGFFPISIIAASGALSALPTPSSWPFHHGLGGILGDAIFGLVTNLFATINADRAGLAASIVLIAAALTAIAKSIGLDRHDVKLLLVSSIPKFDGSAFSDMSHRFKRAFAARRERAADASSFAYVQDDRLEEERDEVEVTLPDYWPEPLSRRHHAMKLDQPVHQAAHHADPHAYDPIAADVEYEGIGSFEMNDRLFDKVLPPRAAVEPEPAPVHIFTDEPTDASSRAMAERFAPASASRGENRSKQQPKTQSKPSAKNPGKPAHSITNFAAKKRSTAYSRPSLNLLSRPVASKSGADLSPHALRGTAKLLEEALADFGVKGEVKDIRPGPVVTLFEYEPARGTKSSRIVGLADDIARSLSATAVRAAVIPGRNVIGIEVPNARRDTVFLRDVLDAADYRNGTADLPVALGRSITGEPLIGDLARMPHLLVAGTTGSGKSVGVNGMILSLLFRHSPEDCRFLMIDPKMLELSVYNGIPHLITPVVTDPAQAVNALDWAVREMEERYKRMSKLGVRSIDVFNNRVRNARKRGEMLSRTVQTGFDAETGQAIFESQNVQAEPMPRIVIVIDELADLMVAAGKDVENSVQRLAQMARAAGIHLIMATQRPSVDVITGTIKANFPTRISYKVTSRIDSRTILNEHGAEQLLGQGDMLYAPGNGQLVRIHGAFVSDEEIESVVDALRSSGSPQYVPGVVDPPPASQGGDHDSLSSEGDLFDKAVAIVIRDRKASTSYLQRRLGIGYNRAADLIERLEQHGIISPPGAMGKRDILTHHAGGVDAH